MDSYVPFHDRKKYVANIGVVLGQRSQLWWNIPVIESFKVLKDIYRIKDTVYNRSLYLFNGLIDLKQYYHTPVRKLSLGQKTLCNITAAFLHSPKLIFLDEPTIGLDVSIKKNVRKIIFDGPTVHFNQTFGSLRTLRLDIEYVSSTFMAGIEEQINRKFPCRETIVVKQDKDGWVMLTINQDEIPLLDVLNFAVKTYQVLLSPISL